MINVQLDKKDYEPGEQIQGKLTWNQIGPSVDFDIRLIWYTLGKGSRDCSIVSSHLVAKPNISGDYDFSFEAPTWPHSFTGQLISLQWAIEVVELPSEQAVEAELIIAPGRKEILLPGDSFNSQASLQASTE